MTEHTPDATQLPTDGTSESLNRLMTVREVAKLLRLSPKTLYKLVDQKSIPAIKVGSQWRFERDQIKAWLTNQGSQTPGDATAP